MCEVCKAADDGNCNVIHGMAMCDLCTVKIGLHIGDPKRTERAAQLDVIATSRIFSARDILAICQLAIEKDVGPATILRLGLREYQESCRMAEKGVERSWYNREKNTHHLYPGSALGLNMKAPDTNG